MYVNHSDSGTAGFYWQVNGGSTSMYLKQTIDNSAAGAVGEQEFSSLSGSTGNSYLRGEFGYITA